MLLNSMRYTINYISPSAAEICRGKKKEIRKHIWENRTWHSLESSTQT